MTTEPYVPWGQPNPRAEIFAQAPLESIQATYSNAIKAGDTQTVRDCEAALDIKRGEARQDSGRLIEVVEPPSQQNGNRYITRYTGDPMAWMGAFMTPGSVCEVNAGLVMRERRAVQRATKEGK